MPSPQRCRLFARTGVAFALGTAAYLLPADALSDAQWLLACFPITNRNKVLSGELVISHPSVGPHQTIGCCRGGRQRVAVIGCSGVRDYIKSPKKRSYEPRSEILYVYDTSSVKLPRWGANYELQPLIIDWYSKVVKESDEWWLSLTDDWQ